MSVLACNREKCENVMCDRFSHTHGYICNDCFKELVSLGPQKNIGIFMKSEPNKSSRNTSLEYFNDVFPLTS